MRIEPTFDHTVIVLVGSFNPKIFHPSWLALNGLVSAEQAKQADVSVIHEDVASFRVAYMQFEIQSDRFHVRCETVYKEMAKDIVVAIFGQVLPHSLIWRMGINRSIAFACSSENARDRLGRALAPPDAWGAWGQRLSERPTEPSPHSGMVRLAMIQRPRPDHYEGYIQADVKPAPFDRTNVVVDVNSHFEFGTPKETVGATVAVEALSDSWLQAMQTSEFIVDGLMASAEKYA